MTKTDQLEENKSLKFKADANLTIDTREEFNRFKRHVDVIKPHQNCMGLCSLLLLLYYIIYWNN